MTINDQIRDEKLQYDINREAAKISALSSDKIRKYEYLTDEDIYIYIFFLSGFSFTNIHDSRDSRGRGRVSI